MPVTEKFVTDEYHEGKMAYEDGHDITTNPYLSNPNHPGKMWYWIFGWQDGMAADVRSLKGLLILACHNSEEGAEQ
jgi:hypothetical protein